VVVAWLWLEQAHAAGHRMSGNPESDAFYQGKLAACRYFFRYELPKVTPTFDLLEQLDDTTLTMQESWF
jgi:hypothetical protein